MQVVGENKKHRPILEEYKHGVKASLQQCLRLTLHERLQEIDLSQLNSDVQINFRFNWGLDGSGEHSNPHQLSKVHYSTKQVISVCFSMTYISVVDDRGAKAEWNSCDAGTNKPQNVQPLSLFPAKEEKVLLQEFIPIVEEEISKIQSNGIRVELGDGSKKRAICKSALLSMIDGKMITSLLQLGGAYCTMCSVSLLDSHKVDIIENGFTLDRSIKSITELALSLTDPETGDIPTKVGDYKTRQGVMDKPLTESDITKNIPVCHSKMRSFEWFIELLYRNRSHKKWWAPGKKITYTNEEKEDYARAVVYVKDYLYRNIAVNVGNPGDMVTGNSFVAFSSDHAREVICELVENDVKEKVREIHLGLCAIVKIINSQKRTVNTDALRELSKSVHLKIVQTFPWAVISQSVHRILAHSADRIELNNCKVLRL